MTKSGLLEMTKDQINPKLEHFFKENNIECLKVIGSGSYSTVCLASLKDENNNTVTMAIKTIDTRQAGEYVKRFLPRELEIVKAVRHHNICRVDKVLESSPYVCLVTEFCEGGDLLQKISDAKRINEVEARFLFRQLIEALSYLAEKEIVHRDLKCENIFLDKHGNVKLGDFGFARYLKIGEKSNTFCGSRAYVAPEILRSVEYTGNTVDIWSAGIVLFIMVTGVMPYDDRHPQKMIETQLKHKIRFPRNSNLSMDVRMLIYEILHPFPPNRPTFHQMKKSKWLEGTAYTWKGPKRDSAASDVVVVAKK